MLILIFWTDSKLNENEPRILDPGGPSKSFF